MVHNTIKAECLTALLENIDLIGKTPAARTFKNPDFD